MLLLLCNHEARAWCARLHVVQPCYETVNTYLCMKQVSIAGRRLCENLSMFHQSLSIDITFNHLRPAPMPLLMDPEFVVCISAHSVHLLLMGGGIVASVSPVYQV